MKIKLSETTPIQINWLVAKIEEASIGEGYYTGSVLRGNYAPSTDWALGGQIIERERLQVSPSWKAPDEGWTACVYDRMFEDDGTEFYQCGPTLLIAAMRCYVASRLGNEVEIPDELI